MTDSTITTEMPTLADTCMLAVFGRKRLSTTRRADRFTEDTIRTQLGDDSITLNKHLFKSGPVRDVLRILDRAYAEHKQRTAPWVDRGPRILPAANFQEYAHAMEQIRAELEPAVSNIIANWDQLVLDDIAQRQAGKTPQQAQLVQWDEYPSAEDAAYMFSMEWKVRPINKGSDFRTQVPDYVKEKLNDELNEAVDVVRRDIIKSMLEPVTAAVEKLKVPIGEKGSIFRDSLVENLSNALHRARSLNVTNDPAIDNAINDMNLVVNGYIGSADSMREMEQKRKTAAEKLDELKSTFTNLL